MDNGPEHMPRIPANGGLSWACSPVPAGGGSHPLPGTESQDVTTPLRNTKDTPDPMQPARPAPRGPGGFSPLPVPPSNADGSRPRIRRIESSSSEDTAPSLTLNIDKARSAAAAAAAAHQHLQQQQQQQQPGGSPATPIYASFTSHPNGSSSSLHNFSRPTLSTSRSATGTHSPSDLTQRNGPSPLTLPPTSATSPAPSTFSRHGHTRKTSQNAGMFEPILPSTSTSNLSHVGLAQPSPKMSPAASQRREMSASYIAAQTAVMQHQSQQQAAQQAQQAQQHMQQQQQQLQHARQRSQTLPAPGAEYELATAAGKRTSGGPLSPPVLSLTEASAPRDHGFGTYHNGLVGNHTLAATTAANVVFPRSGQTSPGLPPISSASSVRSMPPPSLPPAVPEKPVKAEKSKVKLFSRPGKISVKTDIKDKPLPSPAKIGHSFSNLQRGNFSTTSLDSTATSFYNQQNSSTATIRAVETPTAEKEVKEKEKKHHFLTRQKNKLKEEFHLPLSSASSNSRPSDPHAPSSLYNFNLAPASPAPNTNSFKSMSGLDLRHGGRALREKRKEERVTDDTASTINGGEFAPSSLNSATASLAPSFLSEPFDSAKFGLNNMSLDDAWPLLKAKLLTVFEAEELRLPIEDFNRMVTMHIQYCITRRSPNMIVEDLRDLLTTGFASIDSTLRKTPDDRLIPALVDVWTLTFTTILPYLQAVFLPLDMEFSGTGALMTPDQARDFWGGVPSSSSSETAAPSPSPVPASSILEVRRLALLTFRDVVILPRYDTLKTMFSRLSLEFLPQSLASMALASPVPVPSPVFQPFLPPPPQTYSTSPATESSSQSGSLRTVDYTADGATRSRAISNVSFGSDATRPFTPSSMHTLAERPAQPQGQREQNVEGSKQVTEMVGRMLQCMSVLASVGHVPAPAPAGGGGGGGAPETTTTPHGGGGLLGFNPQGNRMVEELNKLLKLNWLGRGRTGRNRRGIVGGRVKQRGGMVPPPLMGGLGLMMGEVGGER
ncbi:hypothetical protein QBC39DRAFT_409682 [Podospora conica]|nr:hypothetical protein QBC39DRAFT_409682 [Schizothecium conicum]